MAAARGVPLCLLGVTFSLYVKSFKLNKKEDKTKPPAAEDLLQGVYGMVWISTVVRGEFGKGSQGMRC